MTLEERIERLEKAVLTLARTADEHIGGGQWWDTEREIQAILDGRNK